MNNASTVSEARSDYEEAPSGSAEEEAALTRWKELSMIDVNNASTYYEALTAYKGAPSGSESEKAAIRKMNEF